MSDVTEHKPNSEDLRDTLGIDIDQTAETQDYQHVNMFEFTPKLVPTVPVFTNSSPNCKNDNHIFTSSSPDDKADKPLFTDSSPNNKSDDPIATDSSHDGKSDDSIVIASSPDNNSQLDMGPFTQMTHDLIDVLKSSHQGNAIMQLENARRAWNWLI